MQPPDWLIQLRNKDHWPEYVMSLEKLSKLGPKSVFDAHCHLG